MTLFNDSSSQRDTADEKRVMYLYVPNLLVLKAQITDTDIGDQLNLIIDTIRDYKNKKRCPTVRDHCQRLLNQVEAKKSHFDISFLVIENLVAHLDYVSPSKSSPEVTSQDNNDEDAEKTNIHPAQINETKKNPKASAIHVNKLQNSEIVQNIGFVNFKMGNDKIVLYKCFNPSCDFVASDSSLFSDHLTKHHHNVTWNHYCGFCSSVIYDESNNSIFDEMRHLESVHINPGQAETNKTIDETNKTQKLRPRLRNDDDKNAMNANVSNEHSLVATYKCMEESCNFFTFIETLFASHLKCHENIEKVHQKLYDCSYCEKKCENSKNLIDHINARHKSKVINAAIFLLQKHR